MLWEGVCKANRAGEWSLIRMALISGAAILICLCPIYPICFPSIFHKEVSSGLAELIPDPEKFTTTTGPHLAMPEDSFSEDHAMPPSCPPHRGWPFTSQCRCYHAPEFMRAQLALLFRYKRRNFHVNHLLLFWASLSIT